MQSKIDEQENKLENVDEMWNVVEAKVDDLLLKEKKFYKENKHGKSLPSNPLDMTVISRTESESSNNSQETSP